MLIGFLSGMVAMGFITAALFFLRFWRKTRDALFLAFGTSFALLALTYFLPLLLTIPSEEQSLIFLIRLAAFALLIVAIVRKNTSGNFPQP